MVGGGQCSAAVAKLAEDVGRAIATAGAVLVCGGLGGVMEAAARGARQSGGLSVGILPGPSHRDANPFVDLSIVTDLGHARNAVVVRSSHAVIALPGEYGTLSEVALALKVGIPVVGLKSWGHLDGVVAAEAADEAVSLALSWAERVHATPR
ncbi:MAG: TIGR00725 family protein [Candidatus Rokubacteria bacterium]|nr:TIGR00725 family protein [Candidatus Rokubacteria bacterium]